LLKSSTSIVTLSLDVVAIHYVSPTEIEDLARMRTRVNFVAYKGDED
jgi:hypothetical protein